MWEAEHSLWQITHAEIGKVLADMWDFPPMFGQVIAHHHNPNLTKEFPEETSIVHISDYLCRVLGVGSGGDPLIPKIDPFSWERIGLSQADHEQILTDSLNSVSELLPVFS